MTSLIWISAASTPVSCWVFSPKNIGGYFYNRRLYDAQALLAKRIEGFGEAILELEKPTRF